MPAETHSHRSPIDPEEVAQLVRERLAEIIARDPDELRAEVRLREDLDIDDYAILDLVEALEEELGERTVGFRLDDDDLGELHTVGDAIECIVNRVEATR